ncbi:hypothetical protein CEXT_624301 [Caerostris extrusa]|uniref:Uncharacterized protein n=1 Tax=Caerostris extrusa TaxID=172846 RepID=A0AAV4QC85_CAEEX|nr:hypothetical protein CEXT_624301 [Caerostris extrusa]
MPLYLPLPVIILIPGSQQTYYRHSPVSMRLCPQASMKTTGCCLHMTGMLEMAVKIGKSFLEWIWVHKNTFLRSSIACQHLPGKQFWFPRLSQNRNSYFVQLSIYKGTVDIFLKVPALFSLIFRIEHVRRKYTRGSLAPKMLDQKIGDVILEICNK